jgi:1-acyl-sn-glycerol-3-phosphate acyltransferase
VPASLVRFLARTTCRLFYRVDRVGGALPAGAVLLLPNHSNALLDPAIVWATAGRDVRFLAKSTLFRGPLAPLVAGAGAIPVYRPSDAGAEVSRNTETFAAVDAALAAGDVVCVFPEGISHSTGRLEPLRTGAARMALSAERAGTRVSLVPIGLNFERKTAFRSRGVVVYGAAFSCADLARDDEEEPVRRLTDRIASHMRQLLVEADPAGDAALVERVERLYAAARLAPSGADERLARRRVIAAGIERLRASDPQRYNEILLQLRRYDERLQRFGFRDRHLDWDLSHAQAVRFALRELALAAVLLPLSSAALVVFAAPYRLTALAARRATNEPDVTATAKVVGGALIYTAWLASLGAAAWRLVGPGFALLVLSALVAVAIAGLFAIERETAVADAVRAWVRLRRTGGGTRERLRRRRSELADVLDDVGRWLAPTTDQKK